MAVSVTLVAYLAWANWLPPVPASPPLPVPNGYDAIVATAHQLPRRNVARVGALDDPLKFSRSQLRESLAASQPVLKQLPTALRLAARVPEDDTRIASAAALRELMRRLSLASRVEWQEGRPARAFEIAMELLELSDRLSRGGSAPDHLTGDDAAAYAAVCAERCLPDLTAAEARVARSRFDALLGRRQTHAEVIRDIGSCDIRAFRGYLLDRKTCEALIAQAFKVDDLDQAPLWDRARFALLSVCYPKPHSLQSLMAYWNAQGRAAEQPRPVRQLPVPPTDLLAASMVSSIQDILGEPGWGSEVNDATLRLVRLELALHEYRLKHGSYPVSLLHLSPEEIAVLPLDPFYQKPFVYRPARGSYLLYGVGPNGRDDGGHPISPPSLPTMFDFTAPGDFVAGKLHAGAH